MASVVVNHENHDRNCARLDWTTGPVSDHTLQLFVLVCGCFIFFFPANGTGGTRQPELLVQRVRDEGPQQIG